METICYFKVFLFFIIKRGVGAEFYDLAWSPDSLNIVVGSIDKTTRIYSNLLIIDFIILILLIN